jgi:REP element-mobilizing transposase RayT
MKANTSILTPGSKYHVYNRGINGTDIFKAPPNYELFLKKYEEHVSPVVRTYAYCLLKNHFHILLEVKTREEILKQYDIPGQNEAFLKKFSDDESTGKFVSRQLGHLFNGYTQTINKAYRRTGGLFEEPFRRIPVLTDSYVTNLIGYIHQNPQNHGLAPDFTTYPFSSYQRILEGEPAFVESDWVLDWFGGREGYIKFHRNGGISIDEVDLTC